MARLRKMICNLRHAMGLRHSVSVKTAMISLKYALSITLFISSPKMPSRGATVWNSALVTDTSQKSHNIIQNSRDISQKSPVISQKSLLYKTVCILSRKQPRAPVRIICTPSHAHTHIHTYIHTHTHTQIFLVCMYAKMPWYSIIFTRAICLIRTCGMTHSYVCYDSFMNRIFVCEPWLIHESHVRMCAMTHSRVSFVVICECAMTHSSLTRTCAKTHSYPWRSTMLICMWVIPHEYYAALGAAPYSQFSYHIHIIHNIHIEYCELFTIFI